MHTAIVLYRWLGFIPRFRVLRFYEEEDLLMRISCIHGVITDVYEGVRYFGI